MQSLIHYLSARAYPGRGIVLGLSAEGQHRVAAYFIMGRSVNSRNRIFMQTPEGIITRAADESKMTDPSLIIYSPVRTYGDALIVTNGDQTDTIIDALSSGKTFEHALDTRTYEPDAPHYTSRISGMLQAPGYCLSILRKQPDSMVCERSYWQYQDIAAGRGHIIHTYQEQSGGDLLPPFAGAPAEVLLPDGDIDAFSQALWDSLNPENRIALYVRFAPLSGGAPQTRLINQYL